MKRVVFKRKRSSPVDHHMTWLVSALICLMTLMYSIALILGLALLSCALIVLVLAPSCAYADEDSRELPQCDALADQAARNACIEASWDRLDERFRQSLQPKRPHTTTPATPRPGVLNV